MGIIARGPQQEEDGGAGPVLGLDLELRACPTCRRELHPWEDVCPADGSAAVARTSLQRPGLAPPPAHLLDDEPGEDASPQG